jgi:hypothetical protein
VKRIALTALVFLVGTASGVSFTVGTTLTDQRFERKSGSRSSGTYGQYEVAFEAGHVYEIYTSNVSAVTSSDPYLYLLNTSGSVLAQNDDSGGSNNAKIVYTAPTTGTYWIRLRAYSRNTYGFCSLTVIAQLPPPPTTTPELHAGDVLNSQIFEWKSSFSSRSAGTYGQYMIEMTAGTNYTFATSNASGGGQDTYLYLLNSNMSVVKSDDDSGPGYHSLLSHNPSSSGTFYLRLRSYSKGALGTCVLTVTGQTLPPGTPLMPDLITWVSNNYLKDADISWSGSVKRLRLSNAAVNRGSGPMELYGVVNSSNGDTQAYQVLYNSNGSQTTYLVGTFSFAGHEDHNHWHFDDFSTYELRTLDNELVALSDKVTFCLEDVTKYTAESIANTPGSAHYDCSDQGISVGWADVYAKTLSGQWIDITGVDDGTYYLRSINDPRGLLHEEPKTNNVGQITITISGNTVTVQ